MSVSGLQIVQGVYRRLRRPTQQGLAYQLVTQTLREVIAQKKLDLALAPQNALAQMSEWFIPSSTDFPLEDLGLSVLLPIRVEVKRLDSEFETGHNVPIVNYSVLDTSVVGAIAFYGDPLRIVFRDRLDYIIEHQYRIVYESDFEDEVDLDTIVNLPEFFSSLVILETAYELLDIVEDDSPGWLAYLQYANQKWPAMIADKRASWNRYVRMFKGRAQVPKRTFFQNHRPVRRTRFFNQ